MYWLFKRCMKKLVAEYRTAYETESNATLNANMRPDFYWLEKFLNDEYEWEGENGSYTRRSPR